MFVCRKRESMVQTVSKEGEADQSSFHITLALVSCIATVCSSMSDEEIIELSKDQRLPEEGEPVCVVWLSDCHL